MLKVCETLSELTKRSPILKLIQDFKCCYPLFLDLCKGFVLSVLALPDPQFVKRTNFFELFPWERKLKQIWIRLALGPSHLWQSLDCLSSAAVNDDNLCELICWKLLLLILGADSAMGVDKRDRRQIWGRGSWTEM